MRHVQLEALSVVLCIAALNLLSACDDTAKSAGPAANVGDAEVGLLTVSFSRDLKPVLAQRCSLCHAEGGAVGYDPAKPFDRDKGLINLPNSWAEQKDSRYPLVIKPGAPDESSLIYKVEQDPETFDVVNEGSPMPYDVPRVTAQELSDIKQWIRDGALDDTFFAEKVAPVFGTAVTLGGRSGKCTLCHYPGSATGLDILAVFDDQKGLVGAKSVLSKKLRVSPGKPEESFLVEKIELEKPSAGAQMPLHYPRLDKETVEALRTWIKEGASDN